MSFYFKKGLPSTSHQAPPLRCHLHNTPALPSYKVIWNNVLLTSKDVLNFPARSKFTEDEFNTRFWLIALNERSKESGGVELSFYDQLYMFMI